MSGFSDAPTNVEPKQEEKPAVKKTESAETKTVSGGFGNPDRTDRRGNGGWGSK
jgi:hypothetical protein